MHLTRQFAGDYVNNQHEEFVDHIPRLARADFKKIFTIPGSSRANKQQHNNMAVANPTMPLFKGYADWFNTMQPMMLQSYGNLYNLGTQNNTAALVNAMQRHAMMNSLMASRAAMNMYGNSSLAQGVGINAANKGFDASNEFMGQQYDPATLMNHLAAALGQMQTPIQNMSNLASTIYGQPTVPLGPGPLDWIATLTKGYHDVNSKN